MENYRIENILTLKTQDDHYVVGDWVEIFGFDFELCGKIADITDDFLWLDVKTLEGEIQIDYKNIEIMSKYLEIEEE